MAAITNICFKNLLGRIIVRNGRTVNRLITTSEKKKDATEASSSSETMYKKIPDFSKPQENKNWVSYGFDEENEVNDRYMMHVSVFTVVTLVFVGCTFVYWYYPDRNRQDWARREAFIRLHEREQLGLEPVNPNYVDPSKIILPPDEEIGEDEILL